MKKGTLNVRRLRGKIYGGSLLHGQTSLVKKRAKRSASKIRRRTNP